MTGPKNGGAYISSHSFIQNAQNAYASIGTYDVTLCITDVATSFTVCTTKTLTVSLPDVTALFSVSDDKVEVGEIVTFYEQSYPHGDISNWKWEFPNNWYSEFDKSNYQSVVNHVYFAEGTKFVKLSVVPTDAQNTKYSYGKTIYVYDCSKVRDLCSPLPILVY